MLSSSLLVAEAIGRCLVAAGWSLVPTLRDGVDLAVWCVMSGGASLSNPPPLPTLAILASDRLEDRIELLRLGYRGYLRSEDGLAQLEMALRAIQRGELWAERQVITAALAPGGAPRLTQKEARIMDLLVDGLSNQDIAERLGNTPSTIKTHVRAILKKHGVRNRMELVLRQRSAEEMRE